MSTVTNIFVTPSTSLILIKNLSTPTVVNLSNLNASNFSLTVRDTTGLSSLVTTPVRISTIGSARFLDGTSLYLLDKPYGLVNIALRNSTIWQILHTSAQSPATAAANIGTLNASTLVFSFLSSGTKQVSSLTVNDFSVQNNFTINSTFVLQNLSTPNIVTILSTLNIYGNVSLNKQLFVSGPALFQSSVYVGQIQPISSVTRVFSSLGIGGTLSVGGLVTVGSTLHTFSTNTVQTVTIQKSTTDSVFSAGQLQIGNILSTVLGITATQDFVTSSTLRIQQNISTLSGIFLTQSLNVGKQTTVFQSLSTTGNANLFSTLAVASSLRVQGIAQISTNLTALGNFVTSSLSTVFMSTVSSFSTMSYRGLSSMFVNSGLSTAMLQGFGWISIGTSLYTPAVVSSLNNTQVVGDIQINRDSVVGQFNTSSFVGVGNRLFLSNDSYLNAAIFQRSLSTLGGDVTRGSVEVVGNVGVRESAFVDTTVQVLGGPTISSYFVNSFLLSNLQIVTSSPFTSFTASSFTGSNIVTQLTQIQQTTQGYYFANSTFASTTQFTLAEAENTRVEGVRASNVLWGVKQTSLAEASQPQFVINTDNFFAEGLSTQSLRVGTLSATRLTGAFLGNGAGISNVAVPFASLSAFTTVVSTFSTVFLFGSSLTASSLTSLTQTNAFSSVRTSTLLIQAVGFSSISSQNQILALTNQTMVINSNLYFSRPNNRVGLNISSPSFDFHVVGNLYTSTLFYSSFSSLQQISFSSVGTAFFSSLTVSSANVRDSAFYATAGIQLTSPNRTVGVQTRPFELQTLPSLTPSTFGLYSYPSSIALMNNVFIYNDSRKVVVNGLSNGSLVTPLYDFNVANSISCVTGYFSSVNVRECVESRTFFSPSLRIQYPLSLSTNVFSTTQRTLYMNNFLTLDNASSMAIGIKTNFPRTNLDIAGNAYFSTLEFVGVPLANFVVLGSETV